MAVTEKISRLERFIAENPALADVPAMIVAGRPITPREALNYLRAGTYVNEVLTGLRALGIDDPWILCEEFYRRQAAARPELKAYSLGFVPSMSPAESLRHVKARDDEGRKIVEAYAGMLSFMKTRVG